MFIGDFSGRSRPDACPGALQVHAAADGGLARIRVPGGRLTSSQLRELADAASACGSGVIELTSRANVQVRGLGADGGHANGDSTGGDLTDTDFADGGFAARMAAAGLLPSATHERVRNILASPLTGCDGRGMLDVSPLVSDLDRRLCGTPALAGLPGRFLFAFDDGRGDVAWLDPDAGILPTGPGEAALILAGTDSGLRVPIGSAVTALLAAAEAFLAEPEVRRARAWRIGELPGCAERIAVRVAVRVGSAVGAGRTSPLLPRAQAPTGWEPVGILGEPEGPAVLGVAVPLGRLTSAQAGLLADLASPAGVRLTPWRGVVLPGLTPAEAAGAAALAGKVGLVVDPGSPWTGVTACTGRPGCAKSLADVRADATRAMSATMSTDMSTDTTAAMSTDTTVDVTIDVTIDVAAGVAAPAVTAPDAAGSPRTGTLPVHWAGCERRCGRPRGRVADVVATAAGYRIDLDGRSLNCADIEETTAVVTALRGET
ncbi:precorrin-3B synthase [Streptosporangium sp. NPDC051022]|uniref:precorrin-3B synthase n=1 Tax=Streptosporangium sp. NPDC051022 TaxID=3155752 RepID=UPI00344936EC